MYLNLANIKVATASPLLQNVQTVLYPRYEHWHMVVLMSFEARLFNFKVLVVPAEMATSLNHKYGLAVKFLLLLISSNTHRKHTDEKDLTDCGDRHHNLSTCIYLYVSFYLTFNSRTLLGFLQPMITSSINLKNTMK